MKRSGLLLVGVVALAVIASPGLTHPGGTDASGCHKCWTNCSAFGLETGERHCHQDGSRPIGPLPEKSIRVLGRKPKAPEVSATEVEVLTVVDGDTFVARQGERLYLMKLRDLEAPELEQPHGRVARDRLAARIAGERLVVWAGKGGCVVPVRAKTGDGVDLTVWMLKQGLAWASREAATGWRKLEEQARMRKVGLWADRTPEPPWTFRRRMAASEQ